MSSIRYIIQTGLFCQDPDYLVWLPEDPLDDSTAWMITSQKRHTDFLCPCCGEPMHVPNPPKNGAYAAECQAHCPFRWAPLPVPLLSGNDYGTQSVQMSWNENHQTGRCVD